MQGARYQLKKKKSMQSKMDILNKNVWHDIIQSTTQLTKCNSKYDQYRHKKNLRNGTYQQKIFRFVHH